jgi:hypothetical protein
LFDVENGGGIWSSAAKAVEDIRLVNDSALSGAMHFKITKEQLEQLAHGVKRLHEVTEKLCKEKIDSFG